MGTILHCFPKTKNREEQKNEIIEECKISSKVEFLYSHKMDRKSK
jgi:hypothetical protein